MLAYITSDGMYYLGTNFMNMTSKVIGIVYQTMDT